MRAIEQMPNIYREMTDFAVRVLHGDGTPEEIAILPEILKIVTKIDCLQEQLEQYKKAIAFQRMNHINM